MSPKSTGKLRALSHENLVLVRRPFVVGNPGNLKEKNETLVSRKKRIFENLSSEIFEKSRNLKEFLRNPKKMRNPEISRTKKRNCHFKDNSQNSHHGCRK